MRRTCCARRTRAGFEAAGEPESRLIHGDCQPGRVSVDPATGFVSLIDFGDAGTGDPVWDLTVLTLRDPDALAPLLRGCGADARLRRRIDCTAPAYRVMRHLGAAHWLCDNGFDPSQQSPLCGSGAPRRA